MNYDHQFRIKPGSKVKLRDIDPDFKDRHAGHKDAQEEIMKYALRLRDLQELLYAEHKRSLLICLQAMDAGGKDGTPWMTWKIVESSGTGELTGMRGAGEIIIGEDGGHSYVLDYEL